MKLPLWEYTSYRKLRRVWERVPGVTFPEPPPPPKQIKTNNTQKPPKGYMTTREASDYLGVSNATFGARAQEANLPFKKMKLTHIFRIKDVEKLKSTIKKHNFPQK